MRYHPRTARLAVAILAIALVGCGTSQTQQPSDSEPSGSGGATSSQGPSEPTGKIVIAVPQEFLFLDPNVGKYSTDSNVHTNIFDSLVRLDADMRPQPWVAESVEAISPTVWQFKLREGITFTNGEPLNADVVKFTVERVKRSIDPQYPQPHPDYAGIVGAEVVDEYTVNIETVAPDPLLLGKLVRMYLTPPGYIEEVGDAAFNEHPIGSGPYMFVERVPDSHVLLEANPDYWGEPPKVKEVEFRIIPEASTRVAALRAGEVDIVQNLPPDDFDAVGDDECCRTMATPSVRSPFVWIYPQSPQGGGEPLEDKRVRQALNYAVNKQAIVDFILNGHGNVVSTIPPAHSFGYDESLDPYPYDPERARQLLADAGYADGFTLNFEAPISGITIKPVEVAQAIAADLAEVGIQTNFEQVEFATYVGEKDAKEVPPIFLWSWGGADFVDVSAYFRGTMHSESRFSLTATPEIDALIDASVASVDPEERLEPLAELQQYMHDQALFIYLYNQEDLFGVSNRIGDWTPTADELVRAYTITLADE